MGCFLLRHLSWDVLAMLERKLCMHCVKVSNLHLQSVRESKWQEMFVLSAAGGACTNLC